MTLYTAILILHVFAALGLIGLVLLQQGKGADAGAAFGAGASATVFGARGSANFLSRTTAILAVVFFFTSLTLAYLSRDVRVPDSIVDQAVPASSAPGTRGGEAETGDTAPEPAAGDAENREEPQDPPSET